MQGAEKWITLARIVRPQGRRGEVLADLFTESPAQLVSRPLSLLHANGERSVVTIEAQWMPTGRSAGRIVLKLATVDSISQAEGLSGCELQISADKRLALDDGTYYVSDLIGCVLLDGEITLGSVEDVHFPLDSTGRQRLDIAPLFVLRRSDGDELLIPFANEFVRRIDTAARVIEMSLPHGLVELNG